MMPSKLKQYSLKFFLKIFLLIQSQIIDIWRSMVEGPAIDEQRALRSAAQLQPSTGPSQIPSAPRDSDDERDPNEIIQIPSTAQTREYDDESDYGDSDD
jgi:hypothetical protein